MGGTGTAKGTRPMARRPGNPNWGKPLSPAPQIVTAFEQTVRRLKLKPQQYVQSEALHQWALRHSHSSYIPEPLLKAWGIPCGDGD